MTAMHPSMLSNLAPGAAGRAASKEGPEMALKFLEYSDASPTPFHAVATSVKMLEEAGFTRLTESAVWDGGVEKGGKYFFTRNESALIAFVVGAQYEAGQGGVHIVGGHTDSPNFHIKPVSKKIKENYLQVGVEVYGGGIWHTWFDRDLTLAGRVIVSCDKEQNKFETRLIHVKRPLLRIPTLAIHLDRTANDALKINKQDSTYPILGLTTKAAEAFNAKAQEVKFDDSAATGSPYMKEKHHSVLLEVIAAELRCEVDAIQDFELSLADTQLATIGGIQNEFIHAPRLDNQMTCFCATTALINAHASSSSTLDSSQSIRAIALFDNEEVGSVSTHGADSNLLASLVKRLSSIKVMSASSPEPGAGTIYERSIAKSFLISSDMAHGFHPNYPSNYEDNHKPRLNGGPVVKTNTQQRYASTGITTFLLRRVAKVAGVPLQEFVVRNDMPCGSTIGPMMSKTGIRTVDIGNPQLSMHSIRETCGSQDVELKIKLFETFFNRFETIDAQVTSD
jgi:aspartyl aminopeptidase